MFEESDSKSRIPPEIDGIQVNFCKNPACGNFNTPASTNPQPRGPGAKERDRDRYTLSGRGHELSLGCSLCKEYPPVKSNKGIKEELDRISAYLDGGRREATCPNPMCINHQFDAIEFNERYWKHGSTKLGSTRFQCKLCGRTVSAPLKSTHRQRMSHVNAIIFKDLIIKKASLKGITVGNDISMKTLYDKIDFIHRQCLAFAADREKRLPELNKSYLNIWLIAKCIRSTGGTARTAETLSFMP